MKTPILALLLAGATAQKKPEMKMDHAAPMNPVKPGDLTGCVDDGTKKVDADLATANKGLSDETAGLKALSDATALKLKAKTDAIKKVIDKDNADTVLVKGDYTAAAADIDKNLDYTTKVEAWKAAQRSLNAYNGVVEIDSGIADNAGTAGVDESLKNQALVKAKGGVLAIAEAKLIVAKADQQKAKDALTDATNNESHWKADRGVANGLTAGLLSAKNADKTSYDSKAKTVQDLIDDYNSKNGLYLTAQANYDASLAKYNKIKAIYDTVKAKVDGSTTDPGDDSYFKVTRADLVAKGKILKGYHVDFLVKLRLNQGNLVGDYNAFTSGQDCKTATKGNKHVASTTLTKCREYCSTLKYVTYIAIPFQSSQTNWDTEFLNWYNPAGSVSGSDKKYASGKTGCTGFGFTTDGSGTCFPWDTDAVAVDGATALANGGCYERKAVKTMNDAAGTNAKWKLFYDYKVGAYKTSYEAYIAKLDHASGWAAYEVKGKVERKRVADVAVWTKEQVKAKAVMDGYKSATLDGFESTMTSTKNTKNTAYGKITDLAYYQAGVTRDTAKAKYDASLAAWTANTDKVAKLDLILKHMKNALDGDKGTIADLTKAKTDIDKVVSDTEKVIVDEKVKRDAFVKGVTDTKKLMDDAKAAYDIAKAASAKALLDAKVPLDAVKTLRDGVATAAGELKIAMAAEAAKNAAIKLKQVEVDKQLGLQKAAISVCEGKKYDTFRTDVATKASERDSTLKAIEKLIDGRKTYALGATGGRCEKPGSNGDHLKRGKCTAETDCCGAATGRPMGATGPLVTIEVCQGKELKTWGYVAPRAALATTDAAPVNWPFLCIGGASQLAGAAAAVLASAYMMA